VGASGVGGVAGILSEEFFDGGLVGEDGGGVNARGCYLRVSFENELGLLKCA